MNLNEINSILNKIIKEKIKEISNKFLINAKDNIQKNISRPVTTNISNNLIETECRRLVNRFFKAELGKKPQISVCIHREDY